MEPVSGYSSINGEVKQLDSVLDQSSLDDSKVESSSFPNNAPAGKRTTTFDDDSCKSAQDKSQEDEKEAHQKYLSELGNRWFTVEPLLVLYMAANYALWPILQQYTHSRLTEYYNVTQESDNLTDYERCLSRADISSTDIEREFQDTLSLYNALMIIMGLSPTLVVMLFVGPISDRLGRRPILIPQLVAATLTGLFFAIVMMWELPLQLLPTTQLITGTLGSLPAVMMASYAYIADINPPEKRFIRIVIIEVGSGLSNFVGQAFFGWLIDASGFVVPTLIYALLQAVNCIYAIFFLPETILRDPSSKVCTCTSMAEMPRVWFKGDGKGRLRVIWLCFFILFSATLINGGAELIMTFFFLDPPLCWNATLIGVFNGVYFFIKALGSLALMRILFGRVSNGILQLIGLVSMCSGLVCLGLATKNWVPFLATILFCGSTLLNPVTRSIASSVVPDEQQGALFSGMGWGEVLAMILGSFVSNVLYAEVPLSSHGTIYLSGAAALLIPMTLVVILIFLDSRRRRSSTVVEGTTIYDTDDLTTNKWNASSSQL